MDAYPATSVDHNIPFLVLSGLAGTTTDTPGTSESAVVIQSDIPELQGKDAEALRRFFLDADATNAPWNGRDDGRSYRYKIRAIGRSLVLPARRAPAPDVDESAPSKTAPIVHSPFSPLSSGSPLYPDGIIESQWIDKHQDLVPSIVVAFYRLISDQNVASLRDNEVKTDINQLKVALSKSGYRTRLAVVLLSDENASVSSGADGVQERLDTIRRGTGLDPKAMFYVAPRETVEGLAKAADTILTSLFGLSIEYYRDLGRHARKKRARGVAPQPTVPPTSGTSQTLSMQGWNVRYDFKAGVFAEFRQEMDAALRSFEQAYDGLLSAELLEIIPSWNPRWNEARLLADLISIRCIRCHLWLGQSTGAVRRWHAHRDRVADLVERRGRGTNNYGWEAWEARWALIMANMIERVDIQTLIPAGGNLFLQPEKTVMGERLQPWELLHHTGYWYRLAARHIAARRTLAHAMSDEDRTEPSTSTSGVPAGKAFTFDNFMCPEPHEEYPLSKPGVNYSQMIIDCLMTARSQFQARQQIRLSAELSLECAKEMIRLEAWDDAVAVLRPLWEDVSFRSEGWLDASEDMGWTLRHAAEKAGVADIVLAIDWELMHRKYTRRRNWHYDISKSLDNMTIKHKTMVKRSDDLVSSFLSASFVFRSDHGKAGETCEAQLSITSAAFPDAKPIVLQRVVIEFDGNIHSIMIEHESTETQVESNNGIALAKLDINLTKADEDEEEASRKFSSKADLTIRPGETAVYQMTVPLREAGDLQALSQLFVLDTDNFSLEYTNFSTETPTMDYWYGPRARRKLRLNAHTITIEPRPPKMEVKLVKPAQQYYANEPIKLALEMHNAEDADAVAKLEVHLYGETLPAFQVVYEGESKAAAESREESKISGLAMGTIGSGKSTNATILLQSSDIPTAYDITVRASYHLVTDPGTPIVQIMAFQLNIVNPFEANYDLLPRLHPDPWPSLFDPSNLKEQSGAEDSRLMPHGLAQRWCLTCHYASFATEDLVVTGLDAEVVACVGGARCATTRRPALPADGLVTTPRKMQEAQFDLVAQKLSLDDRGPAMVDLAFVILWRRAGDDDAAGEPNRTVMAVPRYVVLGTEPRVLASVSYGPAAPAMSLSSPPVALANDDDDDLLLLRLAVTIENASSHFLTFGLAMEPSDEFGFSGPKQTTVHVLPSSRRVVNYRLLPTVRGTYVRPNLVVRDKYFQKVLRIIPTEGMRIDKDGLLIWVPPEEEEDGDGDGHEPGDDVVEET